MITTYKISPCSLLQPFVSCYLLREFNTQGLDLIRPWFADPVVYLSFFLKDMGSHLINEETGYFVKGSNLDMPFQGLGTQFNGIMIFNGCYSILNICFKPNGFYKLFRFPLNKITDKLFNTDDAFSIPARRLYEQLLNSKDIKEMATYSDAFLLSFLNKQKGIYLHDSITVVSNIMLQYTGLVNVEKFAYEANMSIRNFERRFSENIGIPPKLYCRIIRFNHALEEKIKKPSKDWTTIAYESGYFDQTHFIRDFKQFAGMSPKNFMNQTPPPMENIIVVRR